MMDTVEILAECLEDAIVARFLLAAIKGAPKEWSKEQIKNNVRDNARAGYIDVDAGIAILASTLYQEKMAVRG